MWNIITKYRTIILALFLFIIGTGLIIISEYLKNHYFLGDISSQLGSAILTSGIIGLLYEFYLRNSMINQMGTLIDQKIENSSPYTKNLKSSGITDTYHEFPEEIYGAVQRETSSIKILHTYISNHAMFTKKLLKASRNGATIKILLLAPDSEYAIQRGNSLHKNFPREIINCFESIFEYSKKNKIKNIEIRFYNEAPSMCIYSTSTDIYQGQFWAHQLVTHGPIIKIRAANAFYAKNIEDHFNEIWKTATPAVDYNAKQLTGEA